MDKKSVRDVDVGGKRVFLRADLNVPLEDGRITDDTRIRASLPTIVSLLERGAAVVLASHLGRPKGKVSDPLRMKPVADRLGQLLGRPVRMTGDAIGPGVQVAVDKLRGGDMLMLENLRFHAEEEANDPDFARALAGDLDLYVNDAFGAAHRAHASTEGITHHLPAVAGLLMEREVDALSRLLVKPAKPFHAVIGGAKVSGKLEVLEALLSRCQAILVGGGMANTFLAARGIELGKSLVEEDRLRDAERILAEARRKRVRFMLPTAAIVAPSFPGCVEEAATSQPSRASANRYRGPASIVLPMFPPIEMAAPAVIMSPAPAPSTITAASASGAPSARAARSGSVPSATT